ncbi:hypothetical protein DFP73DRAFT_168388 [Morchella snyderi]|nr:hypothetical protein DFP73DRAFT_168388 [Morchella snyderi]
MSSSNITTPPTVASPPSLTSVPPTTSPVRDPTTPLSSSSSTAPPITTSQIVPTTTQPTTSPTPTSPATTPTSTTLTTPSIVTATQAPITSTFETVIVTTVSPSNETPRTVTQTITSTNISPGGGGVATVLSSVLTSSPEATRTSTAEQPTSSSGQNSNAGGGGLNGTGKVVVAVIVPIIGVAFVAILVLFLWKRRQKTRADAEARRKEVEEYGYNPNDPHGGAASAAAGVGVARSNSNGEETLYEMTESDGAGYRGWGSTNGGRKASNMGSSVGTSVPMSPVGMAFSDGGFTQQQQQQQNIIGPVPDGYTGVATSPSTSTFPAGNSPSVDGSNAPLIHGSRPLTADSSVIGAMNGPAAAENPGGIHRGISNASSNYSAMTQSDQSDIGQPISHHDAQYYGVDDGYEDAYYSSRNPAHPYSGDNGYGPAPVIRDVSARRNTRIETPTSTHFPQQGNSGIAQNF